MDKSKIFSHNMATREREIRFVKKSIKDRDPLFFKKNCGYCHVKSCFDCHFKEKTLPTTYTCLNCHRKYFIGIEYIGLAEKEDNIRYKRGVKFKGDYYLKMRADIHYRAGIPCRKCHTMKSFLNNKKSTYTCSSCHVPDKEIIEHQVPEHLKNLECYACHSSWTVQEYGTFFIHFKNSKAYEFYPLKRVSKDYIKSSFMKIYSIPSLGINKSGKVSPIRPEFILYSTIVEKNKVIEENKLLVAQWKAVFPHTVQRGSVICDRCHFSPKRFLLQKSKIFKLNKMRLIDFWYQKSQKVINGTFFGYKRFNKISKPNKRFVSLYEKKWQQILKEGGF